MRVSNSPTPLQIAPLELSVSLAQVYRALTLDAQYSFWLDSARDESPMSRLSYIGVVKDEQNIFRVEEAQENPQLWQELDVLVAGSDRVKPELAQAVDYPVDDALTGGYVGFMGYEARAALGFSTPYTASTPDALWMPATRFIAYEHGTGRAWVIGDSEWIRGAQASLDQLRGGAQEAPPPVAALDFAFPEQADYMAKVERAQHEIYEGNSYEVCLTAETTTRVERPSHGSMFELYLAQREHNPAPYAAFLNCADFWVLSSSPEKFLTVNSRGVAESKPIKGTVPRGASAEEDQWAAAWLHQDPKTRAENLMIVDLLRNDLSRVCRPETVQVPVLMGVESYSTVHQLVSTIRGELKDGVSAVAAAAACFPGGSMTGAPKPSTMHIIDELEQRGRGVYSGVLGFFGAGGAAHLSIVIRTLVVDRSGLVSLSAGGAIVADSDPLAEYEEMLTKLRAAVPPSR